MKPNTIKLVPKAFYLLFLEVRESFIHYLKRQDLPPAILNKIDNPNRSEKYIWDLKNNNDELYLHRFLNNYDITSSYFVWDSVKFNKKTNKGETRLNKCPKSKFKDRDNKLIKYMPIGIVGLYYDLLTSCGYASLGEFIEKKVDLDELSDHEYWQQSLLEPELVKYTPRKSTPKPETNTPLQVQIPTRIWLVPEVFVLFFLEVRNCFITYLKVQNPPPKGIENIDRVDLGEDFVWHLKNANSQLYLHQWLGNDLLDPDFFGERVVFDKTNQTGQVKQKFLQPRLTPEKIMAVRFGKGNLYPSLFQACGYADLSAFIEAKVNTDQQEERLSNEAYKLQCKLEPDLLIYKSRSEKPEDETFKEAPKIDTDSTDESPKTPVQKPVKKHRLEDLSSLSELKEKAREIVGKNVLYDNQIYIDDLIYQLGDFDPEEFAYESKQLTPNSEKAEKTALLVESKEFKEQLPAARKAHSQRKQKHDAGYFLLKTSYTYFTDEDKYKKERVLDWEWNKESQKLLGGNTFQRGNMFYYDEKKYSKRLFYVLDKESTKFYNSKLRLVNFIDESETIKHYLSLILFKTTFLRYFIPFLFLFSFIVYALVESWLESGTDDSAIMTGLIWLFVPLFILLFFHTFYISLPYFQVLWINVKAEKVAKMQSILGGVPPTGKKVDVYLVGKVRLRTYLGNRSIHFYVKKLVISNENEEIAFQQTLSP